MVRSTHIARASDALPLAASVDDEEVSSRVIYWQIPMLKARQRQNKLFKNTSNKPSSYAEG
jgi:hypothetical protein